MPYITVDAEVDLSDYIDKFSTNELEAELERRKKKPSVPDKRIPQDEIPNILDHAALKLRSIGEVALAYKLDEIRNGEIAA